MATTLILLLLIASLGIGAFAALDRVALKASIAPEARRRLLLLAMTSTLALPLVGLILPIDLPRIPLSTVAGLFSPEASSTASTSAGAQGVIEIGTLEVAGDAQTERTPLATARDAVLWLWFAGIIVGSAIVIFRLIALALLLRRARFIGIYSETRVYQLERRHKALPFSVWGRIYIPADCQLDSPDLRHILLHEQAHARGIHSLDMVLATLFGIIHWYNPLAHYLIRTQRDTLEYIADASVLASGLDRRTYQYHLLQATIKGHITPLVHSFNSNTNQLKQRIIMMNKINQPKRSARPLWAIATPILLAMLWAGNALSHAKPSATPADNPPHTPLLSEAAQPASELTPTPVAETAMLPTGEAQPAETPETTISTTLEEPVAPITLPSFPGGIPAMMRFLMENVKYPDLAINLRISGRVVIQFDVEPDGAITNIEVSKTTLDSSGITLDTATFIAYSSQGIANPTEQAIADARQSLEEEAIRVVKLMPRWTPGTDEGKPTRQTMYLPIIFRQAP